MHIIWHFLSKLPHHSEIQMRACVTLGLETNEGIINIWLKPGQILGFLPHNIFQGQLLKDVSNSLSTLGGQQRVASSWRNIPPASTLVQVLAAISLEFCLCFKTTVCFRTASQWVCGSSWRNSEKRKEYWATFQKTWFSPQLGQSLSLSTKDKLLKFFKTLLYKNFKILK